MAVYQVEEYYVYMGGLDINEDQKKDVEDYLTEEGYSNYEFQDNDTVLVIDDLESEYGGQNLESQIESIIG